MLELQRAIVCLACVSVTAGSLGVDAQARSPKEELKSFYIVTHVVSDAAPFHFEYLLDVKPHGEDLLVRETRLAPSSAECPGSLKVQTVEQVLRKSSPKKVARADLCSIRTADLEAAIKAAEPKGVASIDDTASYSIVVKCGAAQRVFDLPYPEEVDLKKLKRANRRIAALWDLAGDVSERAFGKGFSFHNLSEQQEAEAQTLGAKIVPEIKSGTYEKGFANGSGLESQLSSYSGPVKDFDPWLVEFVGSVPRDLTKYNLPSFPAFARQTRIAGEVRLAVKADPTTGLVTDVRVESGHPLLSAPSIQAVKSWQFRVPRSSDDPIEIRLNFALWCPSQ